MSIWQSHVFIAPYLLYACGSHITSAQEAGVILSLRQSRRSAQTLKSFKKRFSFPHFPHQFTSKQMITSWRGWGWNAEVSSWFLALKVSWGRSGGRCWNIHSLMQKHKWVKFCSCFQAVLRIEKKKCLENNMFISSFWLWPKPVLFPS